MSMPKVGELAPDFELPCDTGQLIRLSALRGSTVVLYFYPRDDTPGCTVEACDFRDNIEAFQSFATVQNASTSGCTSRKAASGCLVRLGALEH